VQRLPPLVLVATLIVIAAVAGLGLSRVPRSARPVGANERAALDEAESRHDEEEEEGAEEVEEMDAGVRLADPLPEGIDTIIVGGGPAPDANEVQIEETIALASEVFGANTLVLFAGGPDTRSVQVRDDELEDPGHDELGVLRRTLGDLFTPRNGRDAHYRATTLPEVHGPATLRVLSDHLAAAIATPTDTALTLVLVGHGASGDTPLDTSFLLWTGEALDALTLSDLLAPAARPVRVIVTSCYAGGLAELAFEGADPSEGPAATDRCGVFATAWDREASGCDPDPARGARDGYAHHLLRALEGNDAEGHASPSIDLNDDDVITLLEAHASARITSRSIDVPTSTSSRLLRAIAPSEGPSVPVSLPDEEAVIEALTAALGDDGVPAMEARIVEVEASQAEAVASLETLSEGADATWVALTSALLSRWPVLDDPFHPDFEATLRDESDSIERFLDTASGSAELELSNQRIDALAARIESLELELALLHRWEEARETIELARRLRSAAGPEWTRYERMRACEDGTP
jgi:hypothetical protein